MDKITIVTVCYNAEDFILQTMESVLKQTYGSIEYIVIDGKSNDRTIDIIESMRDEFNSAVNIEFRVLSEKDSGIYDAMNKGIKMASGDWIIFMNAGDSFHDKQTISEIFMHQEYQGFEGVFGDTIRVREYKQTYVKAKPLEEIKNGFPLPFCHQSVFVRTNVAKALGFDTSYRQAADYDFFVRAYKNGMKFKHFNLVVSDYLMGGVSETNTVKHLKEKIVIREVHGLERFSVCKKKYLVNKLAFKQMKKKIMPKAILKRVVR